MSIDYKSAGVDIKKGDDLVDWLKQTRQTRSDLTKNIVSGIGGFAALFKADFGDMKSPCLVSATDGIGTKIKLASLAQSYQEVGQDLVAMCVNDLICCGARPLFFLDYYATGQLNLASAKDFLTGVKQACDTSDCFLIGGETAEMPGVYQKNDFDAAGFAVGVVDEVKALGAHKVKQGDILLGVESSGFHSNGFSLVRKVYQNELHKKAKSLLTPTSLYVRLSQALMSKTNIHAFCHITGGGVDNIARVIPSGLCASVTAWELPELFLDLKNKAELSFESLLTTFNCGIGFVIILSAEEKDKAIDICKQLNFKAQVIGQVQSGEQKLNIDYGKFRG